ncbi:helix-turn-helix domain-containing protein [Deinococcus cellulosilyticus]|uniref:HTH cro/C1-type domain-containing protein n=1 Tax=Deinococcus cellulosilyticus (strain DSM 18568 / NBRC 106333 / KACC 11606 / 5516J-15) TaxID=1223518 RepID=A0A511MXM5_DEIC1|nr:helix-turn-helix transcriptional regulator [Deinococcus cellulosilyticus]GEM45333.1 hypothetical protein DC3_09680 [Deinococcus cellulosilyticus NBRC 106333 = KACC 11606]
MITLDGLTADRILPTERGLEFMPKQFIDAKVAGEFIRQKREALGLTQRQLVEQTSLPDPEYLSNFERGIRHVGRSYKHFTSIAEALRLSPEEMIYLNPNLERVLKTNEHAGNLVIVNVNKETKGQIVLLPSQNAELVIDRSSRTGVLLFKIGDEFWIIDSDSPLCPDKEKTFGEIKSINFS